MEGPKVLAYVRSGGQGAIARAAAPLLRLTEARWAPER